MQALEKTLWGTMKANLDRHLGGAVHYQRIETGSTGRGIPDINIKSKVGYGDAWVELKVVHGNRVEMRPEQVAWHVRRAGVGGRTFILAREQKDGPRTGKVDRLYLWEGGRAIEVAERGIGAPAQVWQAPFDWLAIFQAMGLAVRVP